MQERSEEQILTRLFELENGGQAAGRAELIGEQFLSLIQDPDDGRGYVLRHGTDETGKPTEPRCATGTRQAMRTC